MDVTLITQAIPLIAMICLVYCASRFELREKILKSAAVMFGKTVAFLSVLYGLLLWISR